MIQRVANNGKVPVSVVRAGKPMQIQLPVSAEHPTLVTDLRGGYPSYFIYGPLVFSTATWQLYPASRTTPACCACWAP